MTFLDYLLAGGFISWILFFALFLTLVIAIERCLFFYLTRSGRVLKKDSKPLPQMERIKRLHAQSSHKTEKQQKEILELEGALIVKEMRRGLWIMGFIGSTAPSLGLFGTILGLIQSFRNMELAGGSTTVQDMAGGIWLAMLTTAFGLAASIPALFFSRFFNSIIENRILDMNLATRESGESTIPEADDDGNRELIKTYNV